MGTDIHYVVEKRVGDQWVGLFSKWPREHSWMAGQRCYEAFTELAGVRGRTKTSHEPRGVPNDASHLTQYQVSRDGSDGHTHSWLSIEDFRKAYIRAVLVQTERFQDTYKWAEELKQTASKLEDQYSCWEILFGRCPFRIEFETERSEDSLDNYRIVFWFDN